MIKSSKLIYMFELVLIFTHPIKRYFIRIKGVKVN